MPDTEVIVEAGCVNATGITEDHGVTVASAATVVAGCESRFEYPPTEAADATVEAGAVAISENEIVEPAVAGCVVATTNEDHGVTAATVEAGAVIEAEHLAGDPANERWELFHETDDSAFDFSSPDEVFTTTPHTTTLLMAVGKNRIVIRRRNQWNKQSQNIAETVIQVNGSNVETNLDPSPPDSVIVSQATGNEGRVEATYYPKRDVNPATKWLIYTTTNGVDPDPALDTPTVVAMTQPDGRGPVTLTKDSGALGNGVVFKALVRVRRTDGGVDFDSASGAIGSVTISTAGPAAPSGGLLPHVPR